MHKKIEWNGSLAISLGSNVEFKRAVLGLNELVQWMSELLDAVKGYIKWI